MGLLGFRCHTNANHLIQDKVYILENIYKSVITNNVRSFHFTLDQSLLQLDQGLG